MPEPGFDYESLIQDALQGMVRDVIRHAAERGLPGDHHFYITFLTRFPGVELPDRLAHQYPREMAIVLQHQYWDLSVSEQAFSVCLSFDNRREKLVIPFAALSGFADPSSAFSLRFQERSAPAENAGPVAATAAEAPESSPSDGTMTGEVVSLSQFRRKP